MEMNGEQLIPTAQQRVWEALNDPEVLRACIPGCDSIEKVSDTEFKVSMTAAVGPVKAKFNGKLLLSDLNPPTSYAIAFEGSGGAAGFGKGGAKVTLKPEGGSTRLEYAAKATVGGKLAQVGSRLIDGVAQKMTNDFFTRFNRAVAPPAPGAAPAPAPLEIRAGLSPTWIVGAIVLAMLIAAYLARGWTAAPQPW
ncbi:MAG: carbon monoxide dehydrogenase subunit G [Burkholderiales bacterium]|nr:carbon monoxide dehydrogenase subunit G [Burkholderiales bacterium]